MANGTFEVNVLLLVEDSDDDILITQRKLFQSILKVHEFIVAKNLHDGIEAVRKKPIDVVLLDLNLPETKGVDTLVEFRKVYNGIIVVVTSLEDETTGLESIRKGADDYIIKSAMTQASLARAVLYARERRRVKEHTQAITDKLDLLDELGKRH